MLNWYITDCCSFLTKGQFIKAIQLWANDLLSRCLKYHHIQITITLKSQCRYKLYLWVWPTVWPLSCSRKRNARRTTSRHASYNTGRLPRTWRCPCAAPRSSRTARWPARRSVVFLLLRVILELQVCSTQYESECVTEQEVHQVRGYGVTSEWRRG